MSPRRGRQPIRAQVRTGGRFVTTVHSRGAASLDGMLALTEVASLAAPLDEVLSSLAERIAKLLGIDVCSIYLRDPIVKDASSTEPADALPRSLRSLGSFGAGDRRSGGDLVLRATHGLPQDAVGAVRMRVGEGLTGFAVECLRPVSVATVTADARNKRFPSLGEERFPALCALPLVDGGRAIGALVVQRRQPRAFGPREVVLIAAMAPAVLLSLERARSRDGSTRDLATAHGAARPHEVTLRGTPAAPGRALGTALVRRARVVARGATPCEGDRGASSSSPIDASFERARLGRAFAEVAAEVAALDAWARPRLAGPARAQLSALRFVLEDARLRGRAFRHVEGGHSATEAVEKVAREYIRVLGDAPDEALRERALEIEVLATRLIIRLPDDGAAGDGSAATPGRVHLGGRLTVFEAVELGATHGAGAVLSAPLDASPGIEVARALGLPVVCDVRALFQWAADGDRVLLDGDTGTVLINPSRVDVAAHRRK